MSFPLTPEQFKSPEGEFEDDMFPLGDIDERLDAWIALAVVAVAELDASVQERAAIAYVNYRGWQDVARFSTRRPESVALDSGKTTVKWSQQDRSYFASQANQAKAIYDEYFTFEEDFIEA